MRIERTKDRDFVNSVIRHPKIYPHVSQDFSPAPEKFDCAPMIAAEGILFLAPVFDSGPGGVFMVHPHTHIVHEVHTCILPEYWGRSAEAGAGLIRWVFEHTPCLKLITHVPVNNRLAYKLARTVGMVDEGRLTRSYLKNGVLLDQIILAISK